LTWEENFLKVAKYLGTDTVQAYRFANRSIGDELGASILGDINLMVITYILMFGITCAVFAKKRTFVGTRTLLSLCGILTVILSMVAGYGFSSGCGVFFMNLHQVLPFILVGIGVDDMFIIVAAFDAQDKRLPTEERLARAMRRCGMSVLFTTATNACAFYLGASSNLPAIQVIAVVFL
jgi:Niemann-Pick C1 protein